MEMPLELIVGTERVVPSDLQEIDGLLIAELSGPGLMSVLDATFGGASPVEIWGFGTTPKSMAVVEIAMQGATTRVTFEETGRKISVN